MRYKLLVHQTIGLQIGSELLLCLYAYVKFNLGEKFFLLIRWLMVGGLQIIIYHINLIHYRLLVLKKFVCAK